MFVLIHAVFAAAAAMLTNYCIPEEAPAVKIPRPIHAPEDVKTIPPAPRTTHP